MTVFVFRDRLSAPRRCAESGPQLVLRSLGSRSGATPSALLVFGDVTTHLAVAMRMMISPQRLWTRRSARYWPRALQSGFLSATGLQSTGSGVTCFVPVRALPLIHSGILGYIFGLFIPSFPHL